MLKLYSFTQFLRAIDFKGYSKWIILNQAVVENHPSHLGLQQLSQTMKKDGGTPQPDEIYQLLLQNYSEKFLQLTSVEQRNIQQKQLEYKSLLKKAVLVTFIFNNLMNMNETKRVINVYLYFRSFCTELKQKFSTSFKRISDWENTIYEVIQILVFNLIANMMLKARSSQPAKRRDGLLSASVVAAILQLIYDKKHVYSKQFEICLAEINNVYSKLKGMKDSQH